METSNRFFCAATPSEDPDRPPSVSSVDHVRAAVTVAVALALTAVACSADTPATSPERTDPFVDVVSPEDQLADLASVDELATEFNTHDGTLRLVLLMSPT